MRAYLVTVSLFFLFTVAGTADVIASLAARLGGF